MASKLRIHPAYYRRLRHYRDRIRDQEGRPQVATHFVKAVEEMVAQLMLNPGRGHSARFEAPELADIQRMAVPGFQVFALFYRCDAEVITLVTVEHAAQDLPARLAGILAQPRVPPGS